MKVALKSDREKVVGIISEAFAKNPSVLFVVRKDKKLDKRIRALAEYSFDTAFIRDGVFLSDDEKGVAICYPSALKKDGFMDYILQVKLILKCIGISRVGKVLKRESILKKHRLKDDHLYFWFLGVSSERDSYDTVIDLRNSIFNWAEKEKLPILLETSVSKNKRVYERFGFETYFTWSPETDDDYDLYFMRKTV